MANVKLIVNPIGVPNKVIIDVQKVDDLGPIVFSVVYDPPHTQRNLTVPDMDPVMLRFFFWESADGVSHDTLLGSGDIDGSLATEPQVILYEFKVGGPNPTDPADLADTYVNADLIGAEILTSGVEPTSAVGAYTVSQRGVGPKRNEEISNNPLTGGFTLLGGDKFSGGDAWFVMLFRKVVPSSVGSGGGAFPGDIIAIPETVKAIDVSFLNREMEMTSGADLQTIQVMDLSTVADKKTMIFNTHRFTGFYVLIDFSNGGSLYINGGEVTSFYMPADECLSIQTKGHKGRVVHYDGRAKNRGDIIGGYYVRRGYIVADGTTYTKAQMAGLYEMVNALPPGVAATFAEWNTLDGATGRYLNKTRYAIDVPGQRIIVPDLRNQYRRFLKMAADAERPNNQPGSLQINQLGEYIDTAGETEGGPDPITADRYAGGPFVWKNKKRNPGKETRTDNYGEIPLITL